MAGIGNSSVNISRGLKGVYFERSAISFIDGRAGVLRYRGYSINDLAQHCTFEEIGYLLLMGKLPSESDLTRFVDATRAARSIPDDVTDLIGTIRHGHPMEVLRTAVSALGSFDTDLEDRTPEKALKNGIELTASLPTIVATHYRLREGLEPISPDPELSHAANFLYMLKGVRPSEHAATLIDKDLILHAEHGSNASSFAARVVTGTGANVFAAVTAAIGALSGPAHGGAAENVMKMAEEIREPAKAAEYVRARRRNREPIMRKQLDGVSMPSASPTVIRQASITRAVGYDTPASMASA